MVYHPQAPKSQLFKLEFTEHNIHTALTVSSHLEICNPGICDPQFF